MLSVAVLGSLLAIICLTRIPLGLVMMFTGIAGISALHPRGFSAALGIAEQQIMSLALNYQFSVLPLFILMGVFIVRAGLADDLFEAARRCLGHLPGGVGMATIVACGGFSAMCSSSAAAAATMARISLPEMEKNNYDPGFAAGTVAAGGTMGVLIPPSGALIIFALLTQMSVSELFVAGIIPGVFQIIVYVALMAIIAKIRPNWAPVGPRFSRSEKLYALRRVWGVIALFALIMGGLVNGWFTATEAGGIGAGFAFLFLVFSRKLTARVFIESIHETARIATMIYVVSAGALVLNQYINLSGLPGQAINFIESLQLSPSMVIFCFVVFYLILGCLMDGFAMIFLTVPIIAPIVADLGFDLVWWAIVTVVVVEISMITPPIGLNVFILKAMLPKLPVVQIFKGIAPYVIADFLRLGAILLFPAMALWLPAVMK